MLGDDAYLMLGLIYRELELATISERFLALAWDESDEPWRKAALSRLLDLFETSGRFVELESLARDGLERYGPDAVTEYYLAEALYRQRKDPELLELLDSRESSLSQASEGPIRPAEQALWRAVAGYRTRQPGWEESFRNFFEDFRAADEHSRMWVYLLAHPDLHTRLDNDEIALADAKRLLAEGRATEAVRRFSDLADQPETFPFSQATLLDFYIAGSLSGYQSATARELATLASDSPASLTGLALEFAGRLYRTAGNYSAAIDLLSRSLEATRSAVDRRRVQWYLLTSRIRLSPSRAASELGSIVPGLTEPSYFSDAFEELASLLVERGEWEALLEAYGAIAGFATPGTLADYELTLAEAIRTGRIPAITGAGEELRRVYLERAAGQNQNLFAGLLAAAMHGESGEEYLANAWESASLDEVSTTPPGSQAGSDASGETARLVESYLRFGLVEEALTLAREDLSRLPETLLIELMETLENRGQVSETIRIAARLPLVPDPAARSGFPLLERRYPTAYSAVFEEVLSGEAVDPWLLYALVREESYFNPTVVSRADAVGLTQLLDETAADVAGRMRLEQWDLSAPLDNLRIGARYLAMLNEQFGGLMKAIAAYNAGQGRVRQWERAYPGLTGILFHRAIPFPETRWHIRNVVVSAVHYGYLYGDRTPSETVRLVFGDSLTLP